MTDSIESENKNFLTKEKGTITSDSIGTLSCKDNDFTEDKEDTTCGIGSFQPKWIQYWATPKMFLLLFSATGIIQGMFFSYRMGVLSTLEKRYAYDSRISGSIVMVEDLTPVCLGAILGYFGSKGHRSRFIASGMFASVFCSFICAIPYFLYGSAEDLSSLATENKTSEDMCVIETKSFTCNDKQKPAKIPIMLIFMLGSFFQGFGSIAYHAIGVPYLDDITKKRNVPLFLAVAQVVRIIGPVFGFLLSATFLKFYENPFVDPGFGPEDPRWIGAWWLGFIVQGTLLLIFTIPMFFFPRTLQKERNIKVTNLGKESLKAHLLGFISALKRLATNVLCIFLWLHTVISVYGGVGHFMMLPRYMEWQFRLSAADASLYSGPPGLIAIILSQLAGGLFIWKFQPKVKKLIIGIIVLEFISSVSCILLMIPQCGKIDLSHNGFNAEGVMILENECNLNCNCSLKSFAPVCGPDGSTTYFSPCFAGCKETFSDKDMKKIHTNCSCVIDSTDTANDFVTEGYCYEEGCWSQALIYITMMPIFHIVVHFLKVAHTMLLLRSINPEDKSVCLGTFEMLLCLFAFFPHPVVAGAMLDSACLLWEKSCGTTGNCWFYDIDKFNYLLHGLSAFFQGIGLIFFFGIYIYQDRLWDFYEDDECDSEENKIKYNLRNIDDSNLTETQDQKFIS